MSKARRDWRVLMRKCLRGALRISLFLTVLFFACWVLFPLSEVGIDRLPEGRRLLDAEGRALRVQVSEEDLLSQPVPLEATSKWLGLALIAAEDQRFRDHLGVDPVAVLRASKSNLSSGRVVSGASTLSTQVIRMSKPRDRVVVTKGIEAFRALQLEADYSKDEILEQYLNRAPFGSNLTGVQAASRAYFNKDAKDLTLGESAMLMGLPQSPSRFRPDRHLDRALKRREYVLKRMEIEGFITADQRSAAEGEGLEYLEWHDLPFCAPHFCDWMLSHELPQGDVTSTLDTTLQRLVESVVERRAPALREQGVDGAAVVVIDVKTGELKAMVGSFDYFDDAKQGQVNLAASQRSSGSTLKPFAFALAIDRGMYTPDSIIGDVPMHFKGYDPRNYNRRFLGPVSVRDSLVKSLNIPAIRAVQAIGLEDFYGMLQQLGLRSLDQPAEHYGLSLVVGTGEVQVVRLANAYACLARGGIWQSMKSWEGATAEMERRVLSSEACWLVADMLSGEERAMAMSGHAADVRMPRFAWKTGTSMGLRDAWTVAWNPAYVVAVWAGNPDGRGANGLVGSKVAAPIAGEIFRHLYPNGEGPWYPRPEGVVARATCAKSGMVCGPECETVSEGWAIAGLSDPTPCIFHRNGQERWPAEIAQWLNKKSAVDSLRITSPVEDQTFKHVPGIAMDQSISFRAAGSEDCFWFVNGKLHAIGPEAFWPLASGSHEILCTTPDGRSDRIRIQVESAGLQGCVEWH